MREAGEFSRDSGDLSPSQVGELARTDLSPSQRLDIVTKKKGEKMKLLILLGVILLLSSVYAGSTIWSNPSVDIRVQAPIVIKPETRPCSNNEWNGYFEDYRSGLVGRNETIKLLRRCDRW